MLVVDHVLPLAHHTQPLVVDDDDLDADLETVTGGQLVNGHVERAVAVDVDHLASRAADLGADGRR